MKRFLILLTLMLGSAFSLGCGGVDQVRVLSGKLAAQEKTIKAYEVKLTEAITLAESIEPKFIDIMDVNKDGEVTREELTVKMKAEPMTVATLFLDAWKRGSWKEVGGLALLFLVSFFGLHITQIRKKVAQYGTSGILGWVLRLSRIIGKEPPKKKKK